MTNKTTILLILALCFSCSTWVNAQPSPEIRLQVAQDTAQVLFILDFSAPFYIGNNVYVLHIGDQSFDRSRQTIRSGKAQMVFRLPRQTASKLEEGSRIWLSYGHVKNIPEAQLEVMHPDMSRYYRVLGSFHKDMIQTIHSH